LAIEIFANCRIAVVAPARDVHGRFYFPVRPALNPRSTVAPTNNVLPSQRYVIPNLRNACQILKLLGRHPHGLKAAEIARMVKVPVTSTLRIMATMHLEGLVRKDNGRYELGPVLIPLGNATLAGTEIRELALPILERLTADTDETSHLAIPCDDRALILAVQDSMHPLRAASRPGFLADLNCSSTGKIFLSYMHADRLPEVIEEQELIARTPRTLTTFAALRDEAVLTRERGYSLDDEEYHRGVRCLAVPVFGSDNNVVAAVGITASTVRFTPDRIPEIATRVQAAADELAQLIGYQSPSR